tara:strand:- start:1938 stop:3518 length:1581 start_codon:yes stop_codon:yes gene_type:complete
MKIQIEGHGQFEVDDNFFDLPENEQQEIANNLIKLKKINKPVSTAQGVLDSALQGLTFGFSDEIAGFFNEDAKENIRNRVKQFRKQSPITAYGTEIASSIPTALFGGALGNLARLGQVKQAIGLGGIYGAGSSDDNKTIGATIGGLTGGAFQKASPILTDKAKELLKKNIPLTIGQAVGGGYKQFEEGLSGVPVIGSQIKNAFSRSREGYQKAIYDEILEPLQKAGINVNELKNKISSLNAREASIEIGNRLSNEFTKILPKLKIPNQSVFENKINSIINENAKKLTDKGVKKLQKDVDAFFYSLSDDAGDFSGEAFKNAYSELSQAGITYKASTNPIDSRIAKVMKDITSSMKETIANKNPEASSILSAIDQSFAKFVPLRKTFERVKTDQFTPNDLLTSIRQSDKPKTKFRSGTANLQQTSRTAQDVIGNELPDSGTATRSAISNLALTGGGGAIGGSAFGIDPFLSGALAGATTLGYTPLGTNLIRNVGTKFVAPLTKYPAPFYGGLLGSGTEDINFFGLNRR